MKKYQFWVISSIIILATCLRFFLLEINPPSMTWDEVAWGYNAYTLGVDVRDEFGRLLPLDYLESFGDFKPPFYAYLAIFPVKLFGLNEFAVRFPSAFFGVLTVLVTYLLTKRLFPQIKPLLQTKYITLGLPEITAFLLTISPWHLMLSRAAFEANVASFLLITGVWLFLKGIQDKNWYLLLAPLPFVLSMYTFNTTRIVAPLICITLIIGFRKALLARKRDTIFAGVIGVLLLLPTLGFLFSPQASLRFKEVNIFSDIAVIERVNQQIANDNNAIWSKVIHNRRFAYGLEYVRHYFHNLSPHFLFIKGDGNPKFSTQDVGQLYLWELPFLIIGILFLFRKKEGVWWLIPIWLLLAIIPAGAARETPHALRIETSLPTWQLFIAYGLVQVFSSMGTVKVKRFVATFLILVILGNAMYFLHGYYKHYPREYSGEWQYGYKEAITYIEEVKNDYDSVYFTEDLGRPYAYVLFYTKADPKVLRSNADIQREALGFVHVNMLKIDNLTYYFTSDLDSIKAKEGMRTLYINHISKVPASASKKKIFYLLNGQPILVAYTMN